MKRLSKRTWSGIVLVAVGPMIYGAWLLWVGVIVSLPLYSPISLAPGKVITKEFTVRSNKYYNIVIEVRKRIPLSTLNCMLGISAGPLDSANCRIKPVLQPNWILSDHSGIIARGFSSDPREGGWGNHTIECVIGHFKGHAGNKYVLTIDFKGDATPLNMTDPHLKVEVAGIELSGEERAEDIIFMSLSLFSVGVGVILLGISIMRSWHNRSKVSFGKR